MFFFKVQLKFVEPICSQADTSVIPVRMPFKVAFPFTWWLAQHHWWLFFWVFHIFVRYLHICVEIPSNPVCFVCFVFITQSFYLITRKKNKSKNITHQIEIRFVGKQSKQSEPLLVVWKSLGLKNGEDKIAYIFFGYRQYIKSDLSWTRKIKARQSANPFPLILVCRKKEKVLFFIGKMYTSHEICYYKIII